jgi:hypothetical protein
VSLLVYFGSPQKVQLYLSWTYGSFGGVRTNELPYLAGATLIGFALVGSDIKALNAFLISERFASTIGIRVRASRTGFSLRHRYSPAASRHSADRSRFWESPHRTPRAFSRAARSTGFSCQ